MECPRYCDSTKVETYLKLSIIANKHHITAGNEPKEKYALIALKYIIVYTFLLSSVGKKRTKRMVYNSMVQYAY